MEAGEAHSPSGQAGEHPTRDATPEGLDEEQQGTFRQEREDRLREAETRAEPA